MHDRSIAELGRALRAGDFSSVELTRHFLDRVARFDRMLNSYITVTAEHALAQARAADARLAAGDASPLCGIPIAQKDIFCTAGIRTSCGSRMLDNFVAPYDATVVERLAAAGAIMLGKTNMDEFAMGSSTENSGYVTTHNPWDLDRVPGGSSGGSAAVIPARMAAGSLGTDTGGSIRQPASLCGTVGLKPSYGRVSRYGLVAYASSLDSIGPFAQTVEDTALLLGAIAGHDPLDSTSVDTPVPDYAGGLDGDIKGLRIGAPKEYFVEGMQPAVDEAVRAAVDALSDLGAEIVEISLPHTDYALPVYYIIAPSEASANLARFDGVRYGHRAARYDDLIDMMKRSRSEGFGPEPKRRILIGTYVLSHGYYDAYFIKAMQVRRLIADDFARAFRQCDVIASPVTTSVAFGFGEKTTDPVAMYLADLYTVPGSLAGVPSMSVPCGFGGKGRPVGLQLMADHLQEARLLGVAHRYQQATDWHRRLPEGF